MALLWELPALPLSFVGCQSLREGQSTSLHFKAYIWNAKAGKAAAKTDETTGWTQNRAGISDETYDPGKIRHSLKGGGGQVEVGWNAFCRRRRKSQHAQAFKIEVEQMKKQKMKS